MEEVTIDRRFRGPAESANGGYACGLLAGAIEGSVEATLRQPPPLERTLVRRSDGEGRAILLDGETVIAEARAAALEGSVPDPVTPAGAWRLSCRSRFGSARPTC